MSHLYVGDTEIIYYDIYDFISNTLRLLYPGTVSHKYFIRASITVYSTGHL